MISRTHQGILQTARRSKIESPRASPAHGAPGYTYDAENRITQVDSGATATYVYDADGHRIRKSSSAGTFDFLYDLDGRELTQLTSGGGWYRSEIYAGGRHLATYWNGTTYFNHADRLGTERARSSATGTSYETCTSLPFGDWLTCTGADSSPLHFTGKERDSESGLDDFEARYYASNLGRFMSPDEPLADQLTGSPQSWNLYTYVRNSPLNNTDPDGLECVKDSYGNFHGDSCDQDTGTGTKPDTVKVTSTLLPTTWKQFLGLDPAINEARRQQDELNGYGPIIRGEIPFGPPGLRGLGAAGKAAEEANYLAKLGGILREAAAGKGNFGLGTATAEEAAQLGRAWVREGATVASDGKTLVSADGHRIYRPPSFKPSLGKVQANLEQKLVRGGQPVSNGHLDIK